MKYDKNEILNTARNLRSKSSGLTNLQTSLSRVSPKKCSSSFYSKRSSLVRRLSNVQNEINSLSNDISNAAYKMSSDDVQNAYYIRQVFNNRTSRISFGQSVFSAGNANLKRSGTFGSSLLFSQMAMNRRSVSSLGNASKGRTSWYANAGNFLRSGATSLGEKIGKLGSNIWNGTSNFFSNAGKWGAERLNDLREWGKSAREYTWKSITKFVLGDYSDDNITALSFIGNIATGIFDVDLPLDVRDLVYDVQHWGEGENFGVYFALDVVALLPVIGVLKYGKYTDDVADGVKNLGKVVEATDDIGKYSDDVADVVDGAKDIGKTVDTVSDAGKATDKVSDAVDDAKDLGKTYAKSSLDSLENTDNLRDSAIEHIFEGQVNGSKGYHYDGIDFTAGKIVPGTETPINKNGVYKAQVEIGGVPKSGNGGWSTFFPKDMSPQEVVDAINEAYDNCDLVPGTRNTYRGVTLKGLRIEMYLDKNNKIISAFPEEVLK